jgi:threonine/homoserine/homoserine lactone efflux protein
MHDINSYAAYLLVCVAMVMTPGPNMVYLVSRTAAQGRRAGFISLGGVVLGFLTYMLLTSAGLSALFLAVPYAYDAVRFAGASYLMWMAWQTLRPGARSIFEISPMQHDGPRKLFLMGYLTSLLNPKIALMYLSLVPQFIDPTLGHTLMQTLFLGMSQIVVSILGNTIWILTAGGVALAVSRHPVWGQVQRWTMGGLLASFAVKIALEGRR